MTENSPTEAFEAHRSHLVAVAYRMLGSRTEADDAVQEAWLRFDRADTSEIRDLRAWLTTVTGRICLNLLRSRRTRGFEPLDGHDEGPVVLVLDGTDPQDRAETADAVSAALLIVLDTLDPAERLAFVLHDVFGVPFAQIAGVLDRTPAATRQLASRARRRVRGGAPDGDLSRQRTVVDAFYTAARSGDFEALLQVLAPDVVARTDAGTDAARLVRGADAVARQAVTYARPDATLVPAVVDGAAGVVVVAHGRPVSVMRFTVSDGRIAAIDSFTDEERLAHIDLDAAAP